jgi:hypothetical protein
MTVVLEANLAPRTRAGSQPREEDEKEKQAERTCAVIVAKRATRLENATRKNVMKRLMPIWPRGKKNRAC